MPAAPTPIERPATATRQPRVWEREILRVAGTFISDTDGAESSRAREIALNWANDLVGRDLPAVAWEYSEFEHLRGGRNCAVAVLKDDKRDVWALRVDAPDKNVAQRAWTTEIVVARGTDAAPMFSLRLLASSHESVLTIEPAVPRVVAEVASRRRLARGTDWLYSEPWYVDFEDSAEKFVDFLLDQRRDMPVVVLSIREDEDEPRLDAKSLALSTVGIARVVVMRSDCSWVLTRSLGKQRSVFGGAARIYMPRFTADSNPFAHRLYLAEALESDAGRRATAAAFRWIAATESRARLLLGEDVVAFAAVRDASSEALRTALRSRGSNVSSQLHLAEMQIAALQTDVQKQRDSEAAAYDEWRISEERASESEARLRQAEFRIQQLTDQLHRKGVEPDSDCDIPSTWGEFIDWCDTVLIGRVALSSKARREVRSPHFEDVALTARCLLWLANTYRVARIEGGDRDLRVAIEGGVYNDRCGADSFELDWEGRKASVQWHIKNGGNTHDPRRCLRVYYFWDEPTQQVVIATLPAHIRTDAS